MSLDAGLVGRTFTVAPYVVTAERLADFAAATGWTYDAGAPGSGPVEGAQAPPTFPIVVAFGAMRALMDDPEVGIELRRVVHGEQRFSYTRPIQAGDDLHATLEVETLRQISGNDIIGTRCDLVDADGAHVVTAYATLVHRGEE